MIVYLYLIAIVILFLLLLATIGGSLIYFGIFESIQVSTGPSPYDFGGHEIVYRTGRGAYSDSSSIFTEICSILPRRTTFGLYLDAPNEDGAVTSSDDVSDDQTDQQPDESTPLLPSTSTSTSASQQQQQPLTTPEPRPQYFSLNNLVNPSATSGDGAYRYLVGAILSSSDDDSQPQALDDNERKLLKSKGYRFGTLPSVDNVVHTKFPYRGIVSVVVAIRRVYPVLVQYIKEHRLCAYPAMEIYHKDSIYFLFPLSQQSQFVSLYDSNWIGTDDHSECTESDESDVEVDHQSKSSPSSPKITLTDLEDNCPNPNPSSSSISTSPKQQDDEEDEDSSTTGTTSSFEEL